MDAESAGLAGFVGAVVCEAHAVITVMASAVMMVFIMVISLS